MLENHLILITKIEIKMKLIKKAWFVWIDEAMGSYPYFSINDLEPVYAETSGLAKSQIYQTDLDLTDLDWSYLDVKCRRCKENDVVEYDGKTHLTRSQVLNRLNLEKSKNKRLKMIQKLPETELFYIQDTRQYVGNSVLWWGRGSNGYTTNIDQAQTYTKDELKRFLNRETDRIWAKSHVDSKIKKHVDMQYLDSKMAI